VATKENRKMASTKEVVDNHLKCFGEGDLKGILSDYAPGAVLFTKLGRSGPGTWSRLWEVSRERM
jgi:hypothetical protein